MNSTEIAIIFINATSMTFGFTGVLYSLLWVFAKKRISFFKLYSILYAANIVTAFITTAYLPIVFFGISIVFLSINKKTTFMHNILSCAIALASFYLMMVIENAIILLIIPSFEKLSEIRQTIFFNTYNSIIFAVITAIVMGIISYIAKRIHRIDDISRIPDNRYNKKILYYFVAIVIVFAVLISTIWLFSFMDPQHSKYYIAFSLILSVIIVLFCLFAVGVITRAIKYKIQEIKVQKDKEITEIYKNEIQNMYNEISDFKHDYMKIYSSMGKLIADGNMAALKDFFEKEITPLQQDIIGESKFTHNTPLISDDTIQD